MAGSCSRRSAAPLERAVEAAWRRLNRLPRLSAVAVFVLGFAYAVWSFAGGMYVADPAQLASLPDPLVASALVWYAFVYAAYFALFAAAGADAVARAARVRLAARSAPAEADLPGRLVPRLHLALAMLAVMPPMVLALDLTVFEAVRAAQGLGTDKLVLLDLLATLAAGSVAAVYAARQVRAPLADLGQAVGRIALGVYDRPAPVAGDDEFGRLTLHFNRMAQGLREREIIRREFGRYLSPEIATRILEGALGEPSDRDHAELRETSIVFTDLEGFTPLTERLEPRALIALLEQYFALIDGALRRRGGIIHSFIGDAVHASFNFADDCPDHAAAALEAALEIQARLRAARFPGGETMRTRIGVHTGVVAAGAIGSARRMNYAMFGGAVNVAMRLEQMNKECGTTLLASGATVQACGAATRRFALRVLGEKRLRGCADPVSIYEVRGHADDIERLAA
ncbi:MAG TPA: adenylate/guanylate cyclase domain-containing protein [Burkholderiales bacterium]